MNALTEIAAYLSVLFPADDWLPGEAIEVRCLNAARQPATEGPRRFFTNSAEAASFCLQQRDRWDVFVGVGWRRCPDTGDARTCRCDVKGGNSHVSRLSAAYVDLDAGKAAPTTEKIAELLLSDAMPPTMIVASGRGVHAYWRIACTDDRERVRRVNQGLRDRFGGDNAVDPARILRPAGTWHRKQQPHKPVRIIHYPRTVTP